jgi:5-formyltetrahydrofolate cyclo-ligase
MEKRVALPRCEGDGKMNFYYINSVNDLKKGAYGIQEPNEKCALFEGRDSALCIVPALSYDKHGHRLGYGGGYYDRFLSKFSGKTVGICYEENICDSLMHGKYDRPVTLIVTEKRIVDLS